MDTEALRVIILIALEKFCGSRCFHKRIPLPIEVLTSLIVYFYMLIDYSLYYKMGDIKMREVKNEVMKTIATLVTTAFGLIAALAWNEAIKAIIGMFFKAGTGVIGLLIYAVLITIIAVIATILIARAIPTEPPVQDVRIVEDTTRK